MKNNDEELKRWQNIASDLSLQINKLYHDAQMEYKRAERILDAIREIGELAHVGGWGEDIIRLRQIQKIVQRIIGE